MGEKLKGVPDNAFCVAKGTHPKFGWSPTDVVSMAKSLSGAQGDPVMGAGADVKCHRRVLEELKEALPAGARVRNMFVAALGRVDKANALGDLAKEILGEALVEEPEFMQPFLAHGIVAAWGSYFLSYWIEKPE